MSEDRKMIEEREAVMSLMAHLIEGDRWLCSEACAAHLGQMKKRTFLESIACREDFPEGRWIGGRRCWLKSEITKWAMEQPGGRRKRAA